MQGQLYFETPPLRFKAYPANRDHFYVGRALPVAAICLHDTDGLNSLDWLSRTPGSNASANRLITRDGTNYKLVDDGDTPWTNGPSQLYTRPGSKDFQKAIYLTVEMEHMHSHDPSWPEGQVQACAWQCVEWYGFYGLVPILSHWQVQGNKVDPQGFPFGKFYHFMVERLREAL